MAFLEGLFLPLTEEAEEGGAGQTAPRGCEKKSVALIHLVWTRLNLPPSRMRLEVAILRGSSLLSLERSLPLSFDWSGTDGHDGARNASTGSSSSTRRLGPSVLLSRLG